MEISQAIFGTLFSFGIVGSLGAIMLRASVDVYNRCAKTQPVQVLSFWRAFFIATVTLVSFVSVGFGLERALNFDRESIDIHSLAAIAYLEAACFVTAFIVGAVMLKRTLPTSTRIALTIACIQLVFVLLLIAVFFIAGAVGIRVLKL